MVHIHLYCIWSYILYKAICYIYMTIYTCIYIIYIGALVIYKYQHTHIYTYIYIYT